MKKESDVVVNASPWITLSVCGQVSLLKKLYENILMPLAVRDEIMAGGKNRIGVRELGEAAWLQMMEIQDPAKVSLLHELDKGEAEVIILALEQNVREVLLDEKVARSHARVAGLKVVGTLGLLLRSKKGGLIPKIRPLIENILKGGIYIRQNIVDGILREAGE